MNLLNGWTESKRNPGLYLQQCRDCGERHIAAKHTFRCDVCEERIEWERANAPKNNDHEDDGA